MLIICYFTSQVTSSANIDLFFIPTVSARSPGARYQVRRSKYSSNKIVANSALRSAEYLNIKVNPEDMNQIELQIQVFFTTIELSFPLLNT